MSGWRGPGGPVEIGETGPCPVEIVRACSSEKT
jgi:hypothetical protein